MAPKCFDCDKQLEIKDHKLIGGVFLLYKDGDEKIEVAKCYDCYKKSPALKNFRRCEVYSRCVGYVRPVQQWHEGKQAEFKDRVTYEI